MPTADGGRHGASSGRDALHHTAPDAETAIAPVPWAEIRGSGRPIVLLHGLADTHDLWRHQATLLARSWTTIAVDHLGHGRTRLPHGPLTTATMADAVAALLDRLALGPAVIVGLSMGGGVAQVLALRRPDLVRALVLVSTSSEFPAITRAQFRSRAALAERQGMAAVLESTIPRWFTPEFMASDPDEVARTERTVLANDPAAFAAASLANAERDWSGRLGQIGCPVLFIGGDRDPADAGRAAATFQRNLPDVRIEIVAGVSHLVPVEAPDRFASLLLAFLDEIGYS